MYKIKLMLCLLFVASLAIAQESVKEKKKIGLRKQLKASTKIQINQLKNGALLVRLKTKKLSIAALRKIGKNEAANELEKKQAQFNANVIRAFKTNFTFCPYYFFYSDYSSFVQAGAIDKVVFLNDSLKPDSSIKFVNKTFLVAEFGKLEQDTAKHFSHYTYEHDENFSVKQVSQYYGGPNSGLDGLIVSSDQLIQLRHPFPYFVRTLDPMPKVNVLNKAVFKMNKKLNKFYAKKNRN